MMRISRSQFDAIAQAMAIESFEREMIAALRERAPGRAAALGSEALRRALRFGVRRARVHGVVNVGLLRTYVELMFELGGLFDTNPLLPWAAGALRDPDLAGEAARMDRLYQGARDYFLAVGAPPDPRSPIREMLGDDLDDGRLLVEGSALDAMWRARPGFYAHVGDRSLRDLVRRGPSEAARLGLGTVGGAALVVALSFVLGHGFAEDPLYPWIQATLEDASLATPVARVTRLRQQTAQLAGRALRDTH